MTDTSNNVPANPMGPMNPVPPSSPQPQQPPAADGAGRSINDGNTGVNSSGFASQDPNQQSPAVPRQQQEPQNANNSQPARTGQPPGQTGIQQTGQNERPVGFAGQTQEEAQAQTQIDEAGAPESYAEFTFPENVDPQSIDQNLLTELKADFKEQNLSQKQAQEMLDFLHKWQSKTTDAAIQSNLARTREWESTANQMGLNDPSTMAKAVAALQKLDANGELRQHLIYSGLDKHPAIIRVFSDYGKQLTPDRNLGGGFAGQTASPMSARELKPEQKVYGIGATI